MINQSIPMKCLTPCFCAGAEQSTAEIRPSAIRGALRWWFRALGGNSSQETQVFGGTDPVIASAVLIRVADIKEKSTVSLPEVGRARGQLQATDPLAYILYYASIAGAADSKATFGKGPRWNEQGSIGPKSTFTLIIRQTRQIDDECLHLLQDTIQAFKHYGSIGLRVTRGLGALQALDTTVGSLSQTDHLLKSRGFAIQHDHRAHPDWISLMSHAGSVLKNSLRAKYGAGGGPGKLSKPAQATALGNIKPTRQTSALYLRPIEKNSKLHLCVFEAPHAKILGDSSKRAHNQQILAELEI